MYCIHMSKVTIKFAIALVLIACLVPPPFKAVNRGKGLLPDPTAMQILTGLNNPATLKMLLNPLSQGHKQGEFLWALNQWLYSRMCSGALDPDVLCVQVSSGQPLKCPCWPTPPSPPPCSSCSFRTRPRLSR